MKQEQINQRLNNANVSISAITHAMPFYEYVFLEVKKIGPFEQNRFVELKFNSYADAQTAGKIIQNGMAGDAGFQAEPITTKVFHAQTPSSSHFDCVL